MLNRSVLNDDGGRKQLFKGGNGILLKWLHIAPTLSPVTESISMRGERHHWGVILEL